MQYWFYYTYIKVFDKLPKDSIINNWIFVKKITIISGISFTFQSNETHRWNCRKLFSRNYTKADYNKIIVFVTGENHLILFYLLF